MPSFAQVESVKSTSSNAWLHDPGSAEVGVLVEVEGFAVAEEETVGVVVGFVGVSVGLELASVDAVVD